MKTEIYMLPAFWGPALVNGDYSGLEYHEANAIDDFVNALVIDHGAAHCLGVVRDARADETPVYFQSIHDAWRYCRAACDCMEFQFDVDPS